MGIPVHPDSESVIETQTSAGAHVEMHLEAGSVSQTIHVVTDDIESQVQVPNMRYTGVGIGLHAIVDGVLHAEYVMERSGQLTIHYEGAVAAAAEDQPDLYLYRYIPAIDDWTEASCGDYVREPDNSTVSIEVCILGDYALMEVDMPDAPADPDDDESLTVFLPLAARP